MSSLRNAVKRVTHKERAQPSNRKKLGLLEKHKDYVIRAKDFKQKQQRLSILRQKAAEKNPDEFYFKMNKSGVKNGIHKSLDLNNNVDPTIIPLMKTQDLGYINYKKSIDMHKIDKLKKNLHLIDQSQPKSHIKFIEEIHDQINDEDENDENQSNQKEIIILNNVKPSMVRKLYMEKNKSYKELKQRTNRYEKLEQAANLLQLERNLTNSKGARRKIVVDEENGINQYKWKRQRAR
eukprot:gene15182-20451_t